MSKAADNKTCLHQRTIDQERNSDQVRLSEDEFRRVYEQGFRTWSAVHALAVKNTGPPSVRLQDALREQPCFRRDLRLKRDTTTRENRLSASGHTTWGLPWPSRCQCGVPTFQQPVEMDVAVKQATTIATIVTEEKEPPQEADCCTEWFRGRPNYLAVLALAWAYILSARWTEVVPGPCMLTYENSVNFLCLANSGTDEKDTIVVDIGDVPPDEARWWTAILTQGQSWNATIVFDGESFVSPWSVCLASRHRFALIPQPAVSSDSSHHSAPKYTDARRFLRRFCAYHDIADQSLAALASVVLFPFMAGGGQTVQLPVSANSGDESMSVSPRTLSDWDVQDPDLDKLLSVSCYTRGLRPILLSVFYEPSIECNAASAWLQGNLAAMDKLAANNPLLLGSMMMQRSPNASFLWLGATILGQQKKLVTAARYGQIPINLHSAAWSGTMQTFLQLPIANPFDGTSLVSRADECRLLYLCRSDAHRRLPLVQWKPFGSTPLEDTDLEVRSHAKCRKNHQLHYLGFSWAVDAQAGLFSQLARLFSRMLDLRQLFIHLLGVRPTSNQSNYGDEAPATPVCYEAMNMEKENISENATRNIFSWLRIDGYTRHERGIWSHEWFSVFEDEDEIEEESNESSSECIDKLSSVKRWLSQ